MEITQLQDQFDLYQNDISELNQKIKAIKSEQDTIVLNAKSLGYTLKNKKFITDKLIYVVDYKLSYYSHFDGHLSEAIEYYYSGSYSITPEQFKLLEKTVETQDVNDMWDELWEIIPGEAIESCGYDPQSILQYTQIRNGDIHFEKTGSQELSEMNPGSTFTVSQKKISEFKPFEEIDD